MNSKNENFISNLFKIVFIFFAKEKIELYPSFKDLIKEENKNKENDDNIENVKNNIYINIQKKYI